jgi:hypothetical protein
MPGWVVSVAWTALASMVSACAFLLARCRGLGRPFGPTSKWWALAVVVITSVLATGAGVAVATAGHHLRAAYIGLVVPSGLWLGKTAERRSRPELRWLPAALASWFTFFVRRMDDRMGGDLEAWCDARLRGASGSQKVLREATIYYHGRITERLPRGDRRRVLDRAKESILHKIEVARLISLDTTQERIDTALSAQSSTRSLVGRFTRENLEIWLLDSAENELHAMLADAYRWGCGKLLIYGLLGPAIVGTMPGAASD